MSAEMQKFMTVARKAGGKLFILDRQTGEVFVLLSLDEFERSCLTADLVAEMTEDELLDKINRDIAAWQSVNKEDLLVEPETEEADENTETEESYYLEPV